MGWLENGASADWLLARHSQSKLPYDTNDLNPKHWAADGLKISQDFLYKGVSSGKALSSSYISEGSTIAEQQIVVAGYRLANVIKGLKFNGPTEKEEEVAKFLH